MSAPARTSTAGRGNGVHAAQRPEVSAGHLRSDRWWLSPLLTVLGLSAFVIYATIRSFWRDAYYVEEFGYLSPFYSPCLTDSCVAGASHFGTPIGELPMFIPLAFLSLPFLLGFRMTCYYYRKAYYRSFWLSPPACAVAEPHSRYTGETRLPLILQYVHRYFFYAAVLITLINTYDAVLAFQGATGGFGFGLGNVILVLNVVMLWAYTLSCHSCRHVVGGRLKHFSKHPVRYWLWTQISKMNNRHMMWAWITLGTLILADLYIMLLDSGVIPAVRFID